MSLMKKRKKPKPTERIIPLVNPELPSPLSKFVFHKNEEENSELQSFFNQLKKDEQKTEQKNSNLQDNSTINTDNQISKQNIIKETTIFNQKTEENHPKPKFNLFNIPKFKPEISIEQQQNIETTANKDEDLIKKDSKDEEINEQQTQENEKMKNEEREKMKAIMGYNKPLGFGIMRTYEYLFKNHMLYKPEEDLIEHRDEFGNKADFKTAFKAQSHRFAGRFPGAKKRQKDYEKSAAKARMENQLPGDTPLQSGKALREALERAGQAHIELTGENKSVIPYIPQEEHIDKALEKKKKRLKKVKKVKKVISSIDN